MLRFNIDLGIVWETVQEDLPPLKEQVKLIAQGGHGYAEILDAYMEEDPFIAEGLFTASLHPFNAALMRSH